MLPVLTVADPIRSDFAGKSRRIRQRVMHCQIPSNSREKLEALFSLYSLAGALLDGSLIDL